MLRPLMHDDDPGLSDELNLGSLISNGVVLCKDGSLLAGWRVSGPDTSSASESEKLALSQRANDAFLRLGSGWTMWYDTARSRSYEYIPEEANAFSERIPALVEAERREQFAGGGLPLFQSVHVLTLQFTPPRAVVTKAGTFFFKDGKEDRRGQKAIASEILDTFEQKLSEFEAAMFGALNLDRLLDYTTDEGVLRSDIINYLDFVVGGERREVTLTTDDAYLDGVLAYDYLDTELPPKLGGKFFGVAVVTGFPAMSHPGILNRLDELAIEYRWSSRMIFLDRREAISAIRKYEAKWSQQVRGLIAGVLRIDNGRINRDAKDMAAQAGDAEHAAASELVAFGHYTAAVVIMASTESELQKRLGAVERAIGSCGFRARVETWNTIDAWIGTVPGHPAHNVRQPIVHSRNLADFLPLATLWTGPIGNECPMYPPGSPPLMYGVTQGNTPFRISFHVSDTAHTLIFGPTGRGKTFKLCATILSELRYPRMRLWAFDYKLGMMATAKACGMTHFDLGSERGPFFCPLADIDEDDDAANAEQWVEACFTLQTNRPATPEQRTDIHRTVELLRRSTMRSLSDFVAAATDPELIGAMRYYTINGTAGKLLDAQKDELRSDVNACFEAEEFTQSYPKEIYIPVFLHLFRKFERGLDGRPACLILDEAWHLYENELFAERLAVWLRALRSKNCHIVMATQGTREALENKKLGNLLRSSCPTKIFLPNDGAMNGGSREYPGDRDYYEMLGLSLDSIRVIRDATPKREYYIVQGENKRKYELALGPKAAAFAGASSKEAIARVNQLEAAHGSAWPEQWLRERGVA